MKFRYTPVALAVFAALGSAGLTPAAAQQAQPQAQQSLERVTITGSNIRRTDQETVSPVEIITREQIERTGQPTVSDVLKAIPMSLGSLGESFSNSFAPGAQGISLRGLGQKTTLVLVNGRRTSGYGFAQNLQDTFVDLNAIPSSAVERIEILKDGASAIYGSDAIAGVVNVILRRDYQGIEVGANVGFFEGAQDYRANIVAGFGDLGKDRFNVFGVLDFYKRDEILLADTKFGETRDYRGEQGGRNFQSLTAGGTWTGVPGTANANERRAMTECTQYGGFVTDYAGAVARGLIAPGTSTAQNLPGNTWCGYDINSALSALPETQRIGFLGRGTFDVTSTLQLFGELGLSRVETTQTFTPPFHNTTGLNPTAAGLSPFSYNTNFAPGSAGNPLSADARFSGNWFAIGPRSSEITSDTYRILGGVKYVLGGWDLESAVGWSKNEVDNMNFNRLSKTGVSSAFGVNSGPYPPTPTSTNSQYNLDRPSTNSQAVKDLMIINFPRQSESELKFIDTRATTEIGTLPGGPIGLATGFEFRKESLKDRPDPRAAGGDILGQGITATDGERDNLAFYGELALPVTRQLEAQLALRYDDYSDFGSALTPKVGLKFKATPELLLRANWGRGFRAPSLPEISPSVATFFVQVDDPHANPPQTGVQVSGVFAGNPNLQPEKSRATTLGVVWEPNRNFNASVDWYQITWTNIVGSDDFQDVVDANDPNRVIRDPLTGNIVTVLSNYRNLFRTETQGVDFDARYTANTAWGRFTTRFNATYIDEFVEENVEYAGANDGSATYPRWRGYVSLDWDQGPWAVTGRVNYIHHYWQKGLAGSFFTPQDPRFQTGTYPEQVPSYTTFDLFGRYNVTPALAIQAAILNVTDEVPPYDPWGSSLGATYLYDPSLYDIRGRQYRLGVNYKFK
jgi:iron complex outermembrane receptor protein